jgi:uncharacterized membrane protein (DUF106 family)
MKIPLSLKLGIVIGILNCITWYAIAKQLGFYSDQVYRLRNFITLGVLVIGIFVSVFFTRKSNNGYIEFKNALKAGMIFSLMVAIVLAIFNYIYYTYITPDTIDYFLSEAKKAAIAHHAKPEEMKLFIDAARENLGSFRLIPPLLFYGLIISLLAGAVMQKKDPALPDE